MAGVIAALKPKAVALTLTLNTDFTYGGVFGTGQAQSSNVSVAVSGGTPPYTYLWSEDSSTSSGIGISTPTLNHTFFSKNLYLGETALGNFFVTVTDAAGRVQPSDLVVVYLQEQSYA